MSSTEDEHFLPSEAERTTALEALDNSAVEGRLGLEEYLRLTDQLSVARTRADLVAVTSRVEAAIEPARPLKRRWWVLLGNRIYRGRFALPERTSALVGAAEIHLDLRGATVVGAAPSIRLKVLVGSLRILVPAGVAVEVDQSSLLGGRKVVRYGGDPDPRRPTIRVRMIDVFGNVHVTDDPSRWSPVVLPAGEPLTTWTPRPLPPGTAGAAPGTAGAAPGAPSSAPNLWQPGATPGSAGGGPPDAPAGGRDPERLTGHPTDSRPAELRRDDAGMSIQPGFTTRPELRGTFGMVAASHWLAAQSGMGVLERDGNAFDAAAAAGFVLEVVEPHQNGPGGEAPMVLWSATEDDVFVVDGQGPAPAAATAQHFAGLALDLVPGTGLLAACVPAALGSWLFVLERFGTMTLREVLSPAIGYARHGFPVPPVLAQVVAEVERQWAASWPTTAELWCAGGLPTAGARRRNEALAATYERILAEAEAAGSSREAQLEAARRAVYEGFVAEAIDTFAKTAVRDELGVHAGVIRGDDLARWRPSLEAPARLAYRDVEVVKSGPWGQGPVLLQQLGLLRGVDVAGLGAGSAELVHVVTECAKLALADREAWYGDPRAVEVPLAELLSDSYCDERRRLVGEQASYELRPGSPGGREPRLPASLERLATGGWGAPDGGHGLLHFPVDVGVRPPGGGRQGAGGQGRGGQEAGGHAEGARNGAASDPARSGLTPGAGRPGDTCHVDVVDRFGNMISATPSGGWLQSSPTIPGLGFCLGTRAQMFWLEQGLPASLAPGKRPRTTLSPGMVLRDGKPALAFGTPGGDQQDQWTLGFLLYHLDLGFGLQAAIDAANWHTTHAPSSFFPRQAHPGGLVAESSLGDEVLEALRARGHDLTVSPAWSLGRVTAVGIAPDGMLLAGADPRNGQPYAVGR